MSLPKSTEEDANNTRIDWHLDNWASYMRLGKVTKGYPCQVVGVVGSMSSDFDGMVEVADYRCAEAVDAIIEDLSPIEHAVIYHVYLHAVYRFPRNNLSEILDRAKQKIGQGLEKKGIW